MIHRYIAKRLLIAIPVVIGALSMSFIMLHLAPGDPALRLLGVYATPENIAILRHTMGLDKPIYVQYWIYLSGVLSGDLGVSLESGRPILSEILSVLPFTVVLAISSVMFSATLGMVFGSICAIKRDSIIDQFFSVTSLLGISAPAFVVCLILITVFSLRLGWLPITGSGVGVRDQLLHLIMPSIALGSARVGATTRITRSCMLDELGKDYLKTLRAKGAKETTVIRHALRNALIPILTVIGMDFGRSLGGTVIIETLFARPGMGKLLMDGILGRDYPVVQGVITVFALLLVFTNLLVDVLYGYVNPQVKV